MPNSFYNGEAETFGENAQAFCREIHNVIEPIVKSWEAKGFSLREMEGLISGEAGFLIAGSIIRKQMAIAIAKREYQKDELGCGNRE
jgi:hypothetical protein